MDPGNHFKEGVLLLLNKPKNWTSFDVVKKVRSFISAKYNLTKLKVGHAGTLDPLATGLLVICTGKLTKKIPFIQKKTKTYTGVFFLGATTPSYDLETKINNTFGTEHISEKLILSTSKKFIGKIEQYPPIYSALKIKGERLYKKARRGEQVKLKKRKVFIHSFNITKIIMPKVYFEINCSQGTYIRSLANDFGLMLDSGGYLSKLCRNKIGEYNLKDALQIDQLQESL
ncbi:MAG: tRNA pseudouridine(55) synthase TruB [Bacteroidota bacterium]|nr:tRNA pseudouridine(55) synthase TruB [Bacteroidota bacterium]